MKKSQIKIGMGQMLVEGGEPDRNLDRAGEMIRQAAEKKCDLILLPELLDLAWSHPSALTKSQPIPGPFSDRLCGKAREHRIWLVAGLTERDGDKVYNSAIFVKPDGEILLKYRKINELKIVHHFYELGQSLSVVETPFGMVGINICADNYIDSLAIGHTLARMGAQIIISPSSWTVDYSITEEQDPYGEKWVKPLTILAKLYDLVIVTTTSVGYLVGGPYEGKKSVGCSLCVDKNGVIAKGPYNEFAGELVVADINIPDRKEKGTELCAMVRQKGYRESFSGWTW
ncbi:MAG: hypothetical protein A3G34_01670 [Candidatus Lindowbacteria bacterium RIFCSPLOWO2_12_FULL_62_27]|nr:MAG: hypothetical protein A3I06_05615 [Candidatus Lindowbacteria bacterium RIFCSPLOWO2_02_FULL_62_12]OGH59019.1 MAG: hypothetical protein A3G34_01670 [Candidatus Lindowbacteria bacterium RIFCSPLOWO2_12_FULL_62_27]